MTITNLYTLLEYLQTSKEPEKDKLRKALLVLRGFELTDPTVQQAYDLLLVRLSVIDPSLIKTENETYALLSNIVDRT